MNRSCHLWQSAWINIYQMMPDRADAPINHNSQTVIYFLPVSARINTWDWNCPLSNNSACKQTAGVCLQQGALWTARTPDPLTRLTDEETRLAVIMFLGWAETIKPLRKSIRFPTTKYEIVWQRSPWTPYNSSNNHLSEAYVQLIHYTESCMWAIDHAPHISLLLTVFNQTTAQHKQQNEG